MRHENSRVRHTYRFGTMTNPPPGVARCSSRLSASSASSSSAHVIGLTPTLSRSQGHEWENFSVIIFVCLFFFGNNLDPFQLLPGLLGTGDSKRVKPLPPFRAGGGGSGDRRLGDPERRQPLPDLAPRVFFVCSSAGWRGPFEQFSSGGTFAP